MKYLWKKILCSVKNICARLLFWEHSVMTWVCIRSLVRDSRILEIINLLCLFYKIWGRIMYKWLKWIEDWKWIGKIYKNILQFNLQGLGGWNLGKMMYSWVHHFAKISAFKLFSVKSWNSLQFTFSLQFILVICTWSDPWW